MFDIVTVVVFVMLALILINLVVSVNELIGLLDVEIVMFSASDEVTVQFSKVLVLSWLVSSLVVVILKLHVFISPLVLLKLLIDITIDAFSFVPISFGADMINVKSLSALTVPVNDINITININTFFIISPPIFISIITIKLWIVNTLKIFLLKIVGFMM